MDGGRRLAATLGEASWMTSWASREPSFSAALQRACEHQMATLQMGKPITVSPEVIAVHQRDLYMASPPGGSGRVEFDAMVRKADQIDKSWRD